MCQNHFRNKTWLLPKQELLMPKHTDCCRLFKTMLSQFLYISFLIFQVSWRWDSSDKSLGIPAEYPLTLTLTLSSFQCLIMVFNCCNNSHPVLLPIVFFIEECPANQIRGSNKRELIEPSLKLPILIHHFTTFFGT
jgi:hypothetical protein